MSLTKITFGRLPLANTPWNGDVNALIDLLVSKLTGTLDNGALVGLIGGSQPTENIGLWLNNNTWENWDDVLGTYLPFPLVTGALFGGALYTTQLLSTANAGNIQLNMPNQNGGTLATLSDISTPPATTTFSGSAMPFDWVALGNNGVIYANLTANVTLTEANAPIDNQRVDIWFEQALAGSGALTVTWPTGWIISTSAALTTRSSASTRYIDHFIIRRVGNITFAEQGKGWTIPTSGAGSDTTPPVVNSINVQANTATVVVSFNKSLQGVTLDATKWAVKKAGVTNAVVSAVASGMNVTITVTNTYGKSATGTVQYTGTDVKDLAGNAAASFGPSAINIDSTGGGGGGGGGGLPP